MALQGIDHGTLGAAAAVQLAQCFSKQNCLGLKQIKTKATAISPDALVPLGQHHTGLYITSLLVP